jgi:hypothetical protein
MLVFAIRWLCFCISLLLSLRAYGADGHAYLDAGGLLGIPSGELAKQTSKTAFGFGFHFGVGGLKGIPLTFGLGMHEEYLASYSQSLGWGYVQYGDKSGFGQVTLSRGLEVRHFDAILRLEPDWHWVRPYLELIGGTSQIFATWSISATLGSKLQEGESSGNLSWSWGYGAGIRVEPWRSMEGPRGSLSWVITLGVRRMYAGHLRYQEPSTSTIDGQRTTVFSTVIPHFEMVEPYLLVGLAFWSPDGTYIPPPTAAPPSPAPEPPEPPESPEPPPQPFVPWEPASDPL